MQITTPMVEIASSGGNASRSLGGLSAPALAGDTCRAKTPPFGRILKSVSKRYGRPIGPIAYAAYCHLVAEAGAGDQAQMSVTEMRNLMGCSEPTASKALSTIARAGLVEVVSAPPGAARIYRIVGEGELNSDRGRKVFQAFRTGLRRVGDRTELTPLFPGEEKGDTPQPGLGVPPNVVGDTPQPGLGVPPNVVGDTPQPGLGVPPNVVGGCFIEREEKRESSRAAEAAAASEDENGRIQRARSGLREYFTDPTIVCRFIDRDWRLVEAALLYVAWRIKKRKKKAIENASAFLLRLLELPASYGFRRDEDGTWWPPPEFPQPRAPMINEVGSLAGACRPGEPAHPYGEFLRMPEPVRTEIRVGLRRAFAAKGNSIADLPDDDPVFLRACVKFGLSWWRARQAPCPPLGPAR